MSEQRWPFLEEVLTKVLCGLPPPGRPNLKIYPDLGAVFIPEREEDCGSELEDDKCEWLAPSSKFFTLQATTPAFCAWCLEELSKANVTWKSNRHDYFPTRDIPLDELKDPLKRGLERIVIEEVAPFICEKFNLSPGSLVKPQNEPYFIVRYTAQSQFNSLGPHQDQSHFSFNLCLSDKGNYVGGGTLLCEHDTVVQCAAGECLVHQGQLLHAGQKITEGTRVLFVGFLQHRGFSPTTMLHSEAPRSC